MSDAWQRLEALTARLAQCHRELGELLAAETEGRIRAFAESDDDSVSGRDRYAQFVVLDLTRDILKLKAEAKALEFEWKYLLTLVESHGG